MKTGLAIKSLDLLSGILAAVTLLILISMAYSGYQEFSCMSGMRPEVGFEGGSLVINATVPNRMYLPLTIELEGGLKENDILISQNSDSVRIEPGGESNLLLSLPIKSANLTRTILDLNVTASIPPFLNFKVSVERELGELKGSTLGLGEGFWVI